MTSELRNRFMMTLGVWMLAGWVGLFVFGYLSPEAYFTVSFIGLVAMMQLYAPPTGRPSWWRGLKMIEAACFLIFGYMIYVRIATFG